MSVESYKKEINDVCEWAVNCVSNGDGDALFFGAGLKGYLVKGTLLRMYIEMNHGNKELAFKDLISDYNEYTDRNFEYRYIGDAGEDTEEIDEA